jgi:hypothetical protein
MVSNRYGFDSEHEAHVSACKSVCYTQRQAFMCLNLLLDLSVHICQTVLGKGDAANPFLYRE